MQEGRFFPVFAMRWVRNLQQVCWNNTSKVYGTEIGPRNWLYGMFDLDGRNESKNAAMCHWRGFKHHVPNEPNLTRDFLVNLWESDWKEKEILRKRRKNARRYSGRRKMSSGEHVFDQPPVSQAITGYLAPTSPEEVKFVI